MYHYNVKNITKDNDKDPSANLKSKRQTVIKKGANQDDDEYDCADEG